MSRVNPKLLYLGGAVVVAALLFLAVVNPLLLGDDSDDLVALPVPAAREPAVDPTEEARDEEAVDDSLEVFSPRDPFQQLVVADGGSGEASRPVPVEDAPASGDVTVALTRIVDEGDGAPRAQLTVDGVDHEPAEGETFAETLRLLDIAEDCATLQIGDERVVLCAGEEVRASLSRR